VRFNRRKLKSDINVLLATIPGGFFRSYSEEVRKGSPLVNTTHLLVFEPVGIKIALHLFASLTEVKDP
jgi:hypothetical protein